MLLSKRIRSQMYYGATMLTIIVLALSVAGLQGVLKFRKLTKSIRERSIELPLAAVLSERVSNMRVEFSRIGEENGFFAERVHGPETRFIDFRTSLDTVRKALEDYCYQLENSNTSDSRLGDNTLELRAVSKIREDLVLISEQTHSFDAVLSQNQTRIELQDKLNEVQRDVSELPKFLKARMDAFAENARLEYHTWITLSALMTIGALVLLIFLMRRFHQRIFQPLEMILDGSRKVAGGNYHHRIRLRSNDEVAELAAAFNAMTHNFQEIKSDLDRQVRDRTSEVVRSEQLASVGFLAAGVAHEINNPLASIAWSAESLEGRIHDILNPAAHTSSEQPASEQTASEQPASEQHSAEIADMKKYLKRIQDEAFRCKGITSSLLDFSRLGDAKKSPTNLRELISGVLDMLRPLSRYRDKRLSLADGDDVVAHINAQEIKQVVLNLVTNALDNTAPGGCVDVSLTQHEQSVDLVVTDNGCGMTEEVLKHIFEPFYTRRPDGQGTGLGLSITYRIIQEHKGTIHPESDGPGRGSRFTVTLPLSRHDQEKRLAA